MKKPLIFLLAVILFIFPCLTACSSKSPKGNAASSEKVIVMKLASANPVGDIKDLTAKKFAEYVGEKTKGRVKVEVYSGGTLGDWREAIEGLGLGVNEIVLESIGGLDAYSKLANIDAIPYIFRDYEHFNKVWNGSIGLEIMDKVGQEGHFKILGPMYRGARIVTSKKKFENLAELKGLKIRAPNIQVYIKTWQSLGAAPTPLALTETFTALQQGTVDAQENPTIESYGHGFYDVAKYLILTNHVYSADMFIFNDQYFNNLPKDIQSAVEESAKDAAKWRNEFALKSEAEYVQKFKDKGCTVVTPKVEEFRTQLNDFTEKEFPYLVDYVNRIKAVK